MRFCESIKMTVNVLGIQWKDNFKKLTVVLVVLVVLFSSFAQAEKEPVEADGAKSDNPPSVVS
jgi:hypothetical protein